MVSGALAVRHHPHPIAFLQIDGGDAAVRRLEQRQPPGPGCPGARAGHVIQVRDRWVPLDDVSREGAGDRLDVQNSRFRIECPALPVCAPDRAR